MHNLLKRRNMKYEKLKKGIVSGTLTMAFILSSVFVSTAFAMNNSGYDPNPQGQHRGWDRREEREELQRIRRMDRNRQLRYRNRGGNRIVGYYDRFGRFQAYGYYDRFGRFYRY